MAERNDFFDFSMDLSSQTIEVQAQDLYTIAVETFRRVEAIFGAEHDGIKKLDFAAIQELRDCRTKLESISNSNEKDELCLNMVKQLHAQVTSLISKVQNRLTNFPKNMGPVSHNYDLSPQGFGKKKPAVVQSDIIEIINGTKETPRVTSFGDIVGLQDVIKTLKTIGVLPKTQPQLFTNVSVCNTVLLYGPPGTGKTRLVHALAAETGASFHCISAGDLLSHYVGQTEKTIKALFQHLKGTDNFTIMFLDEIDGFCRKRCNTEQEHTRRIKTQLMLQLSDVTSCRNLLVISATNCPWDLDPAILRRFQKRLYVPLPNPMERAKLIELFFRDHDIEGNFQLDLIVEKTAGYSGSDMFDVVQHANEIRFNELEDTKIWKVTQDGFFEPVYEEEDFVNIRCSYLSDLPNNSVRARKTQMIDLLNAVETVNPTVSRSDVERYEMFNKK